MVFKHFNVRLFAQLLCILVFSIGIGLAIKSQLISIVIILAVIDLMMLIRLVHFLNKTNSEIAFFIQSIKNDDNSIRFPINTGNAIINDLHGNLNELNNVLHETKVQSRIKEQYFSVILQNIETGIIILTDRGFINDANPSALEILGLKHLTHIKQIESKSEKFAHALKEIGNNQKVMLTYQRENKQTQIITLCTEISLKNENVKLITLQDIQGELEKKEVESWVKLIRVMNHEIMNSLAPVTSIAQSLHHIWKQKNFESVSEDDIESTTQGLEVISERSQALKTFVQSYRLLTQVPKVNKETIGVFNFLQGLVTLLAPFNSDETVDLKFKFPKEDFEVNIDRQLLVQVVINLVKNSIEAAENQEKVTVVIQAEKSEHNSLKLVLSDNGSGIPQEMMDQVFIPFFTTKENGTGVGLSHSRQIIRAHGGAIQCESTKGETVFTIEI